MPPNQHLRWCFAVRLGDGGDRRVVSSEPCPSGLHASVAIPSSACTSRNSCCGSSGCSSTWLTAGTIPVPSIRIRRCSGAKLLTRRSTRIRPWSRRCANALKVSTNVLLLGHRPVDQVEVEIAIDAEPLEAGVERRQRLVVSLVGIPQFGDQEHVLAAHAGLGDRPADLALVAVDRGGVDMPVTRARAVADRLARSSSAGSAKRRTRRWGSNYRRSASRMRREKP